MARILLILGAFMAVTMGLVFFQPGKHPQEAQNAGLIDEPPTSTRLADDLSEAAIIPPLEAAVTRAQTNLLQIAQIEPENAPATPDNSMRSMTSGVLSGLTKKPKPAPASVSPSSDDRAMTLGVLANIKAAKDPSKRGLQTLIVQALREGQSDAYIDQMINAAAYSGDIAVPAELITATGRVDTQVLLATLVDRSQDQTKSAYVSMLNAAAGNNTDSIIRSSTTPQNRPHLNPRTFPKLTKSQKYTVQSGDSLAAISYRFYGQTAGYRQIFDANSDFLTSPDKIRIGQVLIIPVL